MTNRYSISITENEWRVLRALATNRHNPVPAHLINDAEDPSGIEGGSLSGVTGNLAQKGLIQAQGPSHDGFTHLTVAGRWIAENAEAES